MDSWRERVKNLFFPYTYARSAPGADASLPAGPSGSSPLRKLGEPNYSHASARASKRRRPKGAAEFKKTLYGLKESPRARSSHVASCLEKEVRFVRAPSLGDCVTGRAGCWVSLLPYAGEILLLGAEIDKMRDTSGRIKAQYARRTPTKQPRGGAAGAFLSAE